MVKRICIMFILILGLVSAGLAAEKKEAKESENPKAAVTQASEKTKEETVKDSKAKEAYKELENTLWKINLTQITQAEKKERLTDVIRFKDSKVEIESLASQGFPSTSFTISIKGDENNIVVWETMQTSEKKGLVFWKGEIEEGRMRGVLSRHIDEKTVKDYTFYSTGKEVIQEETPPPPAAEPAAASEQPKIEE